MTVVLFGDVVAAAVTALGAALTVPVSGRVPNPRPDRFVTISRTGGPRRNLVTDAAQLTVDSWGQSDPDALALAELARREVHRLARTTVAGLHIYGVDELSGPGVMPDESGQPRYRQTFTVATRGT